MWLIDALLERLFRICSITGFDPAQTLQWYCVARIQTQIASWECEGS